MGRDRAVAPNPLSLTLPDQLAETARLIDYKWPNCDEQRLAVYSEKWRVFAEQCEELYTNTDQSVEMVVKHNEGEFIEAFDDFWNRRVRSNSMDAHFAASEIALRLSHVGGTLATEKMYALNVLNWLHEELRTPVIADELTAHAINQGVIDSARAKMAEYSKSTRFYLDRATTKLDEAQQKLAKATEAMAADRAKLEAAP